MEGVGGEGGCKERGEARGCRLGNILAVLWDARGMEWGVEE